MSLPAIRGCTLYADSIFQESIPTIHFADTRRSKDRKGKRDSQTYFNTSVDDIDLDAIPVTVKSSGSSLTKSISLLPPYSSVHRRYNYTCHSRPPRNYDSRDYPRAPSVFEFVKINLFNYTGRDPFDSWRRRSRRPQCCYLPTSLRYQYRGVYWEISG